MFLATNIRRYADLMRERGFDRAQVLAGSGIAPAALDDDKCLADVAQCRIVIENLLRLSGDSGLGLTTGASAQIADLGIISHALMSSRTLRELVTIWIEYSASLVGSLIRPILEELQPDGDWSLTIPDTGLHGPANVFLIEDFCCTGIHVGRQLAGRALIVREVEVSYPAPPHAAAYPQAFAAPVRFGAPRTRIVLSSPHLGQSLRSNDELFLEICVRHCQQVLRQIAGGHPLATRLRSLFLQSPGAIPGMAQAAHRLGLGTRTLRRRLEQEGSTYAQLVDQFRRDLAIEYLRSGHLAPKEVAYLLGFSSPSTFRRAFKIWTRSTVGEFLERERPARLQDDAPRSKRSDHVRTDRIAAKD